jgi:hypothetical protein
MEILLETRCLPNVSRTYSCRHVLCSKLKQEYFGIAWAWLYLKNVGSIVFESAMFEVMGHWLKVDGIFDSNEGYTPS